MKKKIIIVPLSLLVCSVLTLHAQVILDNGGSYFLMRGTSGSQTLYAENTGTGKSAYFQVKPTATNTVVPVMTLNRSAATGATSGIGGAVEFYIETNSSNQLSNRIINKWSDVNNATRTSQFIITGVNNATEADLFTVNGNGSLRLNKYGTITPFTGTLQSYLAVDNAGNVIEMTTGGGVGANTALSNLAAVAINTSLISDANNTDDLGSTAFAWKDVHAYTTKYRGSASGTTTLQASAAAGTTTITLPAATGTVALTTSPIFVTPTLGAATATSINKVAITAPATSATLTIANGKTLTVSNTLTFTGTDASSVAFGAGGTVPYVGGTNTWTGVNTFSNAGNKFTALATDNTTTQYVAVKADGTLVAADKITVPNPTVQALDDDVTPTIITWDLANGYNGVVTLDDLTSSLQFANLASVVGRDLYLKVVQDGTGNRLLTLPASCEVVNGGAGALTLTTTPGAVDGIAFKVISATEVHVSYGRNFN